MSMVDAHDATHDASNARRDGGETPARDDFVALHRRAVACARSGRIRQGIGLIRRALRRNPASAAAYNDLGAMLTLAGRINEAAAAFGAALAHDPAFATAHYNLGAALRVLRRIEPALDHFRRALAADPGLASAHADLGTALAELGRLDEALPHCRQALALAPDNPTARVNLGKLLQALGRPEEALACLEPVTAHRSVPPALRARQGLLLMQLERFEEAGAALREVLASRPDFAEVHCNLALRPEVHIALGNALQELGHPEASLAHYRAALAVAPDDVDARNNMAAALAALSRHDNALAIAQAALDRAPQSVEAHHNIAIALAGLGREDDALAWYDRTIALDPGYAVAWANKAAALKVLGRFDEARDALRRAIALDPHVPRFYRALIDCVAVEDGRALRGPLEALTDDSARLPPLERIHLHFTLAHLYDEDEPETAFRHLHAGNALQRRLVDYDEPVILAGIARLRAVFPTPLPHPSALPTAPRPIPIFIVGMPRSGTTLIEQILASHPDVFGAGELECFPIAVGALIERERRSMAYPEMLGTLDVDAWARLGADYRRAITALAAPAARCVTDKLPLNGFHVGLICRALPDARIVHVRRDPLDTCFSCFSKLFAGSQPFAYDLGELGRYYRAYDATMAHWRAVLPEGSMIEMRYEDVIADLEGQARRLIAHCGLPWGDACLGFHKTTRPVRTASVVQVRRPLYRDAIGRAQRYRPWLGPLIDALAEPPPDATARSSK